MAMTGKERQLKYRKKAEEKLLELVNQLERKVKGYSASLEEKKAAFKVPESQSPGDSGCKLCHAR